MDKECDCTRSIATYLRKKIDSALGTYTEQFRCGKFRHVAAQIKREG